MTASAVYLDDVTRSKGRVTYRFHTTGPVKAAFKSDAVFEIDFYESVEEVPLSVLVIPFVANVLPIVWLYDATLHLPELDKDFYDNINGIKSGYAAMYPKLSFHGSVEVDKLIATKPINSKPASALLFSGGVDATSSLISLLKKGESPRLVTLWGADVALDDDEGWEEKAQHTKRVADIFELDYSFVRTNFKSFLDEVALNEFVSKGTDDMWWHGFQHGIGIIGHTAPLVYLHGIESVNIAASFTKGEAMTCASDPTIDENVHMAGCVTIHDGYDYSRQDKIANIHSFVIRSEIESLPIKVCWISSGAKNCGRCEKCIRTACGFLVENGDLEVYDLASYNAAYAKHYITNVHYFRHTLQWQKIQDRLASNKLNLGADTLKEIGWLSYIDLETINNYPIKQVRQFLRKVKHTAVRQAPRKLKQLSRSIRLRIYRSESHE